jgi:hypothetical protein
VQEGEAEACADGEEAVVMGVRTYFHESQRQVQSLRLLLGVRNCRLCVRMLCLHGHKVAVEHW